MHTDGFSFFVDNTSDLALVQQEYHAVTDGAAYADELRRALHTSTLAAKAGNTVYALVQAPATRVPFEHFRKDEAEALYCLTFAPADARKQTVFYNILPRLEVVEISAVDKEVEQVLQERYAHRLQWLTPNSRLLKPMQSYDERQPGTARRLYAYCREADMFLFSFEGQKLRFANSYTVAAPSNAIYYLLYAWKLLGFDAQQDECRLINATNGMQQGLRAYLRHVDELQPERLFPSLPQTRTFHIPFDILTLLSDLK